MVSKIEKVAEYSFYIVIDNRQLARWQSDMLEFLAASGKAKCLKVISFNNEYKQENTFLSAINSKYIFGKTGLLENIEFDEKVIKYNEEVIYIDKEEDVKASINECKLDFILNLTERSLTFEPLEATFGTWHFPFCSEQNQDITSFFVKAFLGNNTYIECNLVAKLANCEDGFKLLSCEYSSAYLDIDLINEILKDYINCLPSLIDKLKQQSLEEYEPVVPRENGVSYSYSDKLKFKWRHLSYYIKKLFLSEFYNEAWSVGLKKTNFSEIIKSDTIQNLVWHDLSLDYKFVADPFLKKVGDKTYLLVEAIGEKSGRGLIVCYDVDEETLALSNPRTIFQTDGHLSYPYLIEENNEIFCVPEMGDTGLVTLYRSKVFPLEWVKVSTLIRDKAVLDASIIYFDGIWWLFCSETQDGPLNKLRLWYSDNLKTGWIEHPSNPIVQSIRRGRSGGAPFIMNGKLYRPAQNAAKSYGGSLQILEITKITKESYEEVLCHDLYPDATCKYKDGLHTLSMIEDMIVVDGKILTFSYSKLLNFIFSKLKVK